MKGKFCLFAVLLVIAYALYRCGEETPQAPRQQQPSRAAAVQQPRPAGDLPQPVREKSAGAWPFLSGEGPAEELADNYTAKNYFLIFDGSGSMADSQCSGGRKKIEVAKEVVAQWSKTVPADANLGLYAFHNGGRVTLPLTTGKRSQFIAEIQSLQAGGRTPLSEAVSYAYTACTRQGQRQLGYGEYTIVVVTDGIANNENLLANYIAKILDTSPVNIYSIGFCIGENHSLNQPGRTIYKAADNPAELRKGLEEVLAESETFDENEFSD